jgi:coenzyme F420-reducing hydrogenase alpha subunit
VRRATTVVLFLATALIAGAQPSSIDADKLAQIRRMSPEERAKLSARLQEIKKLAPEERERLKENLKKIKTMAPEELKKASERAAKLSDKDHKELSELASGFFKWSKGMGYQEGFPRGLFFQWLKREKPGKIEEIRLMEAGLGSPRVDEFIRLYHEFQKAMLAKTEEHVRRHKCASPADVHALGELAPKEFWPRWQEMTRGCAGRRAMPGPVPPRLAEPTRK